MRHASLEAVVAGELAIALPEAVLAMATRVGLRANVGSRVVRAKGQLTSPSSNLLLATLALDAGDARDNSGSGTGGHRRRGGLVSRCDGEGHRRGVSARTEFEQAQPTMGGFLNREKGVGRQ